MADVVGLAVGVVGLSVVGTVGVGTTVGVILLEEDIVVDIEAVEEVTRPTKRGKLNLR